MTNTPPFIPKPISEDYFRAMNFPRALVEDELSRYANPDLELYEDGQVRTVVIERRRAVQRLDSINVVRGDWDEERGLLSVDSGTAVIAEGGRRVGDGRSNLFSDRFGELHTFVVVDGHEVELLGHVEDGGYFDVRIKPRAGDPHSLDSFDMGALDRWLDHMELRRRPNAVLELINGNLMTEVEYLTRLPSRVSGGKLRARRGHTPERYNLPVEEGWTGEEEGLIAQAARRAGYVSASDFGRDVLRKAMEALGVLPQRESDEAPAPK